MSYPPTIEPFKGTNWEECNHFIRALRAAAWKEGKSRDLAWVADFAGLHFSHKALKWHSRLPQDVREDWAKLQVALLDRWSPPEDDDEPRIEPTPAAALSLNHSDKANRPSQGVLKLIKNGSNTSHYLKICHDGRGVVVDDANDAIRIRCNSLLSTTVLERIDGSRDSWLGVQWRSSNPHLKNGSTDYGYMVLVNPIQAKTSWGERHLYQPASCTVSADGEVIPFWTNEDNTKITIGVFYVNKYLYLAADSDAYARLNVNEGKAKIFVEPIN